MLNQHYAEAYHIMIVVLAKNLLASFVTAIRKQKISNILIQNSCQPILQQEILEQKKKVHEFTWKKKERKNQRLQDYT